MVGALEWVVTNRSLSDSGSGINITIDGYVIPRVAFFEELKEFSQEELVRKLYLEFGESFIHRVKGIFTIIIEENNNCLIFSDRSGIKKYFIYRDESDYYISNSLTLLAKNNNLEIDYENGAVFLLFSHFIGDYTLFKKVNTGRPGGLLRISNGIITSEFYWEPGQIIKQSKPVHRPISFYSESWKNILHGYLNFLKPDTVSLTLTGGNDSRMVLAGLLKLPFTLRTFTYGDPMSHDGIISSMISNQVKLEHVNYFESEPSAEWFGNLSEQIVEKGNSLVNIHRAHRYDAAEKESQKGRGKQMVFTGLLGGEFFKEPWYDNKVMPVLFRDLQGVTDSEAEEIVLNKLKELGVETGTLDLGIITKRIRSEIDLAKGYDNKGKKFIYTWNFYGAAHHSQDSNVFGHHFSYVVNPFMDIDYIELIAGSDKWYPNSNGGKLRRLFHSDFLVGITDSLAPELSALPYAKKGEYTADDLLGNKLVYLVKRVVNYLTNNKKKYPRNFPMGLWLNEFCMNELLKFPDALKVIVNVDFLRKKCAERVNMKSEEEYQIMTNPVNLNLIYERFCKGTGRNSG